MSEQPLTVNFTQENDVLRILASPPLISSQELNWDGIYVQHYQQPAWETPEYSHTQHMLLIHTSKTLVRAERMLDGRKQREQLGNGNVALVPATVKHQVNWDRENNFSLLFLEPAHLAHIAYGWINIDRVELIPQFATLDPLIHPIGLSLKSEIESNGLGSRLFVDSLTTALSLHLVRSYSVWQQPLRDYTGGLPRHKLQQAIAYINEYLNQDLSLEVIASTLGMSQYYFARLFKQSMGIAPYQYVIQQRVERAKQLLKQRELSIAEIALRCGFASQSHLNRHFRQLTGMTPKAYQEM